MASDAPSSQSMTWLFFALLTVASWGLYGVCLHAGQMAIFKSSGIDMVQARYKAFLFVGIAYFLVAILAPLFLLKASGASLSVPPKGALISLLAGTLGATGAFGILLAFGAAPPPTKSYVPVVMSIVFAGAPVVNAIVALSLHPPAGGLGAIRWQFVAGILIAALGGFLVMRYKPEGDGKAKEQTQAEVAPAAPSSSDRAAAGDSGGSPTS